MTNNTPDYNDNLYFEKKKMEDFKPFSKRLLEQKIKDCDRLKKQLDIAVATLELYALEKMYLRENKTGIEFEFANLGYNRAKEALEKIKELDKNE